ncbi:MAG: hypothetical protein B9J98_03820 [Candidatus Terraquivivens tikiterensis]|uniref:Glutamine amidotransferase type-2 domain-containing protein n=1 Tax=Candidatus Terraquivivens tikiterensis TaxID=1980982 RepID=A0A2R7Y587_9ARCH|nr:MAG: hypothetical protein B9J98_03820 [Candidatus Terraquivivens tikiterensis]
MLRATGYRWSSLALWLNGDFFDVKGVDELSRLGLRGRACLCSVNLSAYQDSAIALDGEIYNLGDAHGGWRPSTLLGGGLEGVQEKSRMRGLDGSYAFVIMHDGCAVLARDPVGTRPLYVASDGRGNAFATERKALLAADFQGIRPLKPGHVAFADKHGLRELEFYNLPEELRTLRPFTGPSQEIASILLENLRCAVAKMVKGKKVGVLFSGGLDSSIIAKLSSDLGMGPRLVCAGLPTSKDVLRAKRVAEVLGLELHVRELDEGEIEKALPEIARITGRPSPLDVSIATPLYFASMEAKEAGLDRVLVGQGADEAFAGYKRYEKVLEKCGYELLGEELLKDVSQLYEKNLERDYNTYLACSVEPAYPYLDVAVLKCAFMIPVREKLKVDAVGYSRKHILRVVGKMLGLPEYVVSMPKSAIQYGSGVWKVVKRVLKNARLM